MKIALVYGGRDFGEQYTKHGFYRPQWKAERQAAFMVLDEENPDGVIEGGARGADSLGREWADQNNKQWRQYPAKWRINGVVDYGAGFKRNTQMVQALIAARTKKGDEVMGIECEGGNGTADTHRKLVQADIAIRRV